MVEELNNMSGQFNSQAKMSAKAFSDLIPCIPHGMKLVGIILGVCVLVVVMAAVIAYFPKQANFSQIIIYLSDVRVTPVWPQIGLFPTAAH
jgi:hypothetical protein